VAESPQRLAIFENLLQKEHSIGELVTLRGNIQLEEGRNLLGYVLEIMALLLENSVLSYELLRLVSVITHQYKSPVEY